MILIDTSAWVEYDRATGSAVHHRVRGLIADDGPIATTEPVIAEILAGANNDKREANLRRLLNRFTLLPFESPTDFDGAIRIYRFCRSAGITPRGLVDCMIAAVAVRHGASVLCYDADLVKIAEVVPLVLDVASSYGALSSRWKTPASGLASAR